MPTFVNPNACNACAGEHLGPLCVYICPNDLMALDADANKGFNQEPSYAPSAMPASSFVLRKP